MGLHSEDKTSNQCKTSFHYSFFNSLNTLCFRDYKISGFSKLKTLEILYCPSESSKAILSDNAQISKKGNLHGMKRHLQKN